MKARRVGRVMLVAVFGAALALTTASFSQHSAESATDAFLSRLVDGVLDPPPSLQELSAFFIETVKEECRAVMFASPDELQREEQWLGNLMKNAKARCDNALERADELKLQGKQFFPEDRSEWRDRYNQAVFDLYDAKFELDLVSLMNEEVGKCIEKRKPALQGQRWIRGRWTVSCNNVPGITPDTTGRIDLQIHPDVSVTATVYPTDSSVGVEIAGELMPTGAFFLLPTVDRGSLKVEVDGNIASSNPLSASGRIAIVNVVEDYGTSRCSGTWEAR